MIRQQLVAILALFALSFAAKVHAEWEPIFPVGEYSSFRPTSTLEILLPESMPDQSLEYLALEINGIDVSEMVEVGKNGQDTIVSITPVQAMETGENEIRLVEYSPDGEIIERGIWNFSVKQSDRFEVSSFQSSASLDAIYRTSESQIDEDTDRFAVQGSARINSDIGNRDWRIKSVADLVVQTERERFPDSNDQAPENDIELGEYLFKGTLPGLSALVGHHEMASSGLLMRDFHRRGASISKTFGQGQASASGFAFRSEPVVGWREGLGLGDKENRVVGAMASVSPMKNDLDALKLTTMYIKGEGDDHSGFGVAGNQSSSEGDGISLIAESHLKNNRVRLRAELATTNHDFDGDQTIFKEESDNAHSILASIIPWQSDDGAEHYGSLELGIEYQKVDLFFHSLANPSLPTDKELSRIFALFNRGGLTAQAQLARETDNVDGDPQTPTLENDVSEIALSYSPETGYDNDGYALIPWYGQATFSAITQLSSLEHESLPLNLQGFRIDQSTPNHYVEAAFQYHTWGWSAGYGWGEVEDKTDFLPDQSNELTTMAVYMRLIDRVDLGVQAQFSSVDEDTGITTSNDYYGMNLQAELIPNKLTLGLDYSLNLDTVSNDLTDMKTETLGVILDWQLVSATERRPGWHLWIRGERQETTDSIFPENNRQPYQIFLGLRLDWQTGYPR